MTFPRYSEYRNSGVDWLGTVPLSWSVGRLKHLLRIRGGQDYKTVESYVPTEFPVIGSGGQFAYATDYLYDGESVLLGRKGTIDKPLYISGKFWTVDTMFYTEVLPGTHGRYAYYLATTIPFVLYSTNTALPSMSQFDLANHALPLPNKTEQTQIARFLDHETAKIDALIREQEHLIALLQEKRQAVISHAVTKGLDPNVPMKDSGVEWLGEVPEHWLVAGFKKHLEPIVDYRGKTPTKTESGVFLVTARNIKNGVIDYSLSQEFISESDYEEVMRRGAPKIGDVLFTTEAPLGEVAQIDDETIALAQRIIKFRGLPDFIDNAYLKLFLQSSPFQQGLMTFATGSTALGIKSDRLGYLRQLIPPISEQQKIVISVSQETKRYEQLMTAAKEGIEFMRERRSALISAAVTGKIDVREWQPPADDSAFDEEIRQAGIEVAV